MKTAVAWVICYFLGAVPFGYIIAKLIKGIDIREFGSGNIGMSNVLRTLGTGPAVVVLLLDAGKGFAAVKLCEYLIPHSPYAVVLGALLSIIGHTMSVFLKFKGGKGVATTLGVILGLNLTAGIITFVLWVVVVGITRYISIASIVGAIAVPCIMHFWKFLHVPTAYQLLTVCAALAILIKHKSNVQRLLNGTEIKIGQRVNIPDKSDS